MLPTPPPPHPDHAPFVSHVFSDRAHSPPPPNFVEKQLYLEIAGSSHMPVVSAMPFDHRHFANRNEGPSYGQNVWSNETWYQMKEDQIGQKMPGAWFYEEEATSCSPVSDPEDIAQFLNYRASIGVQNVTQSVEVPTSEHVAEIVGRQGCKIKALRAKTNTYIKTPIRGEDPIFVVTGRVEDVQEAKKEIECAAEHFTQIRASRRHSQGVPAPGQVTIYVRVPLRVVGLVVGPKGATIKRIQQDTHTYIITPSRERDPVFEVTGIAKNVEAARKEIETHIFQRTGNFPEPEAASQYVSAATLMQQQAQQAHHHIQQAHQAQQNAAALYRRAFANGIYGQGNNELGLEPSTAALGLDALFRSFPSMRNSLTPEAIQGLGRSSRPSLGATQTVKPEVPSYEYWGNNNSINDIMENEILSRNYDPLAAWSSVGFEKEKREESPIDGLMSMKTGSSSGFGFLSNIWSDNLNMSPGSLASASASPSSSSCDHNDHTMVPING